MDVIEPSDMERATWTETTSEYVCALEERLDTLEFQAAEPLSTVQRAALTWIMEVALAETDMEDESRHRPIAEHAELFEHGEPAELHKALVTLMSRF